MNDQLPFLMEYDLRRRIETFADGNCSSEVFIEELASRCAATPDFIWDVLALIDQYHRRGKISAEFQRSVRELIERPALTHEKLPAAHRTIRSTDAKVAAPPSVVAMTREVALRAVRPASASAASLAPRREASASPAQPAPADEDLAAPHRAPRLSPATAAPLPTVVAMTRDEPLASERPASTSTAYVEPHKEVTAPLAPPVLTYKDLPAQHRALEPSPTTVTSRPVIAAMTHDSLIAAEQPVPPLAALVAPREELTAPLAQHAPEPTWARDGQIVVPVLKEFRRPARDPQPTPVHHTLVLPAQALGRSWPDQLTQLKIQVHLSRAADPESSMAIRGLQRFRWKRSIQFTVLAALVCCVTLSSAIHELPLAPLAVPAAVPVAPRQPPHISLSSDQYIVYPGSTNAVIEVQRTGDTSKELSFTWWTKESGAKSGKDYRGSRPRTEHLAAGADTLQWSIPVFSNAARRHTELFYVFISSPDSGDGAPSRATVFIMSPN